MEHFKTTDDIWFWGMAVLNGTKIKPIKGGYNRPIGTHRSKDFNNKDYYMLYNENIVTNNINIQKLLNLYPQILSVLERNENLFSSKNYWESRYEKGGNSGVGSYNEFADYKAKVINEFIKDNNINRVVEFGCGDGNVMQHFEVSSYTGYDVSDTAVQLCRSKRLPNKLFFNVSDYQNETYDLALSLDVIFHLVEDNVFEKYMHTLFNASTDYVCIYSSNYDDNNCAEHVKHRNFTEYVKSQFPEWVLVKKIDNPLKSPNTCPSDFYFYKKN